MNLSDTNHQCRYFNLYLLCNLLQEKLFTSFNSTKELKLFRFSSSLWDMVPLDLRWVMKRKMYMWKFHSIHVKLASKVYFSESINMYVTNLKPISFPEICWRTETKVELWLLWVYPFNLYHMYKNMLLTRFSNT